MISRRWKTLISIGILGGLVSAGGVLAVRAFSGRGDVGQAEQALKRGQPFHAAEIIDRDRARFGNSEEGCRAALNAYAQVRKFDSMGWMIESCEAMGFEGSELFIAKAILLESLGDPTAAIEVLSGAALKFPGRPMLYVQMARIFSMHDRPAEAKQAWKAAVDQAPRDVVLALEALRFYYDHKDWSADTKRLASRIKDLKETNEPSTLLFLASTLERSGDSVAAHALTKRAQKLFGPQEGFEKRYAQLYPELFSGKGSKAQ